MYSTVAEKEAAEITRLQRAIDRFPNYTLEAVPGQPGTFVVFGGTKPYRTTEHSCGCPDHQYRGVACQHMQMVRGRVLAEAKPSEAERRAEAKRVRDLLWAD